jgi:hypothetical protein
VALALGLAACARPPAREGVVATPQAPRAARDTGPSRQTLVEQALARAPQLNRAAAELLADGAERRGGAWGDPMDASLLEAARGFSRLPSEQLAELGALFGEAYAALSASDRAAVEGYVERVRRGDAGAGDERARGLLAQCVKALPETRRARLQSLLEGSIRAALESERLTALAQRDVAPVGAAAAQPPAWLPPTSGQREYHRPSRPEPTPDHEADEAQLRALGAHYRDELTRLEDMVRYAEQGVRSAERSVQDARRTPLNERPLGDPDVNAAEQRLEDARTALQRARNAVDDLHTKIRRERVPLSYVQ